MGHVQAILYSSRFERLEKDAALSRVDADVVKVAVDDVRPCCCGCCCCCVTPSSRLVNTVHIRLVTYQTLSTSRCSICLSRRLHLCLHVCFCVEKSKLKELTAMSCRVTTSHCMLARLSPSRSAREADGAGEGNVWVVAKQLSKQG